MLMIERLPVTDKKFELRHTGTTLEPLSDAGHAVAEELSGSYVPSEVPSLSMDEVEGQLMLVCGF